MSNVTPAKKNFFDGRKVWLAAAAIVATLTGIVLFIIISQVTATTKYYVLNQDVPARTQIEESMLQEVITSTGGQPPTALAMEDILADELYAQYALDAGDIITGSNAGPLEPITEGVPEGYVTATFTAPASMAAAGKIQRGDYIDLITVTDTEGASYSLQHVIILDATVNLDNFETSAETEEGAAAEDSSARLGVPSMYTVALSPEDATKLALMTQYTIYVVLSADQTNDSTVGPKEITVTPGDLGGNVGDAGVGTDPTFGEEEVPAEDAPAEDGTTEGTDGSTDGTTDNG